MSGFRHLRDELIHRGHVVALYDSYFLTPEGDQIRRDVVRHDGAVSAVPFEDGQVWLVRQYRAPVDGELWELPAGRLDHDGESPDATIVRELEEEIGRHPASVERLIEFHPSPGFCDEVHTVFFCTDLTEVSTRHDGAEELHMEVQRFSFETAIEMIENGQISDAKTIIGLYAAARRLGY